MRYLSTAVCAAAVLAAGSAFAGENPAWTWGQIGYTSSSSGDDTTDAFGLNGSLGIADLFHFQVGYVNGSIGDVFGGPDQDYDGYSIVAGVHPHIAAGTDAVFNLRYQDMDRDDTNEDIDGWGLGAGLRHMLTDQFELNGMINWDRYSVDHVSNGDGTVVSWTVGGRYLATPALSVGVSYTDADKTAFFVGDAATLDVRYQFGDLF